MAHGLKERSVTIDVRDRNHRFVSGATVEMWADGRLIISAENITKATTFHVNDPSIPLRFVAKYENHQNSVDLAQDTWDYEIPLDLELMVETQQKSFFETHLAFIFGVIRTFGSDCIGNCFSE